MAEGPIRKLPVSGWTLTNNSSTRDRLSIDPVKLIFKVGGKLMECVFCNKKVKIIGKISRQDTCPHCSRDLRCCKQCKFYDPNAYNECREVAAERIIDKERANFCDFFAVRGSKVCSGRYNRTQEAKQALEALFKK